MSDLKGKVALVTGGGRGLGEAIVRTLAAEGALVVAADVQPKLVQELAARMKDEGHNILPLRLDVSDREQARQAVEQAQKWQGHLDILVNNAGTDVTLSIEELSFDDWNKVLGVNLNGPFIMSKLVFPLMRQQGRGHIVNITSTAARRAWANASAYHASKWGLLGFSHALHVEGRQVGIKVTAVINGGMRTPFILDRFPDTPLDVLQDPKNVADTIRYILMQPEETVIPEVMILPMKETSWP